MSIFNQRRNKVSVKKELREISSGITVEILDPNNEYNHYKICKIGTTPIEIPANKIMVMNMATGRIVFKSSDTIVEIVKEEIVISDPGAHWLEKEGN